MLHAHVFLVAPLRSGDMPKPGADKHQRRIAIRETADNSRPSTYLPIQPFYGIVCPAPRRTPLPHARAEVPGAEALADYISVFRNLQPKEPQIRSPCANALGCLPGRCGSVGMIRDLYLGNLCPMDRSYPPSAAPSEKPPGVWPSWNLSCWKRFPKRPGSCSSTTRRPPGRSPAQMPGTASSPASAAAPVSHTTPSSAKKGRRFKISNVLKLIISRPSFAYAEEGLLCFQIRGVPVLTERMRRLFTLKKRIFGENSPLSVGRANFVSII